MPPNPPSNPNPTEKPVGETEKKITDEYYCKCCFTFENHENSIFLQSVVVPTGWQSLDGRRQDQRLLLFYKIINGLASVETEDILTPADSRTRKNHSFKFKHLQANCDSYRFSFFQPLFQTGTTFHLALRIRIRNQNQNFTWSKI